MARREIFDSAVRSAGDLAGVYEYDGETGYFYLYDTRKEDEHRIVGAISVFTGTSELKERDIVIRWDPTESMVGLFIRGQLWAVFDGERGTEYGGHYRENGQPGVPDEITKVFVT
jgi:hypothetical protein